MNEEDARLIDDARRGSSRAFGALIDRHQQAVRGFLRRLSGNHGDAEDLSQDVFTLAWTRLHQFDGRSTFRSWLCGIAYRRFLEGRRATQRRLAREAAWRSGQPESTDAADPSLAALRRALAALPREQRAAVALCLAGQWSHAEAADALGLPLGTVKSHVARGRAKLLEAIGGAP